VLAGEPDGPIVVTTTLCVRVPLATAIARGPGTGTDLVAPIVAVKSQFETSLSKCTL
jgi:hypothetical protein